MSDSLILSYDLFDLQTSQHKAGLAGLLLLIESMKKRQIRPIPVVNELSEYSAKMSFTKESMKAVFDDFFAALEEDGKVVPKAKFLEVFGMPEPWIKLWRNAITRVLRAGAPVQLESYRDRTGNFPKLGDICSSCLKGKLKRKKGPLKICKCPECKREIRFTPEHWDWEETWDSISEDKTIGLSATDLVGVESKNAEGVPFISDAKNSLLLNFWPVVSVPFLSQRLKKPKSGKILDYLFTDFAYVLIIPEAYNLSGFVEEIPMLFPELLDGKSLDYLNRPMQSKIVIPEEAALCFASAKNISDLNIFPVLDIVSSITVAHIKYGKGSPDMIELSAISPKTDMLKQYRAIEPLCRNPLFKAQTVNNIMTRGRWYASMEEILVNYPWEFFVFKDDTTPNRIPFFGRDVKKVFMAISSELKYIKIGGEKMSEEGKDSQFSVRVYDLIKQYVKLKAESKSDLKVKNFPKDDKGRTNYPEDYRKTVEKVCSDAFLAMRGRRDQDFVEYFTGTICSVPQYFSKDDFLLVSQSLLDDWERVKTLSMLAISAHSYLPKSQ